MNKKRIKILTSGPIRVKGFINGPVLTPYFEDISTIFAMISQGIHVVEVCDDRTEVRLTTANITEDNSRKAHKERENLLQVENKVEEKKEEPVVEPVVEEVTKVEEEKKEEPVVIDEAHVTNEQESIVDEVKTKPVDEKVYEKPNNNNNQYNNKHNKHNKYNNYNNNYKKETQIRVESPKTEPIKIGE